MARGINWHVAVSISKRRGAFQTITHIHIFSSQVAQDSTVTAYCISDVAKDVMTINPGTEKTHIFTDNAGCYKSTLTLVILRKELGENIKTFNFCEAQDGKGSCDRRASHIKGCIKRYINEGHDVTNATEMKIETA
ncbi:uncharacterized protein LOC133182809 [Saccostrea echinata]|uniref:uncharacterized protein LOC133182809 n=1 Tax=Saccostrea echinata TaxID=191078 RepID=UPI002A83F795|nr:uncharacterized protein LOC133182809 [Saccostrea echinata]